MPLPQLGFLFPVQRKVMVFPLWHPCPPLLKGTLKTWVLLCLRKELWLIQLVVHLWRQVCLLRLKGLLPRRTLLCQVFLLQICLFLHLRLPSFLGLVFLFKALKTHLTFLPFLRPPEGPLLPRLRLLCPPKRPQQPHSSKMPTLSQQKFLFPPKRPQIL